MPTPAYGSVTCDIASKIINPTIDPGLTIGSQKLTFPFSLPLLPGFSLTFIAPGTAPGATTVGAINLFAYKSGTLTATTTTIDMSTLVDPYNNSIAFARAKMLLLCNDATADGSALTWGGAGANPWVAPFNGSGTAKGTVPAGFTQNNINYPGFVMLVGGNQTALAVGAAKNLLLDSGAAAIPYRLFLCGCDA